MARPFQGLPQMGFCGKVVDMYPTKKMFHKDKAENTICRGKLEMKTLKNLKAEMADNLLKHYNLGLGT